MIILLFFGYKTEKQSEREGSARDVEKIRGKRR